MKKVGVVILLIFLIVSLAACTGGSYVLIKGGFSSTDSRLEGQYSSFTGNYYRKATFNEGDTITFAFLENTIEGSLFASLNDKNGNSVFDITDGSVYTIEETGTYKITAHGEKHNGNFIITWEK